MYKASYVNFTIYRLLLYGILIQTMPSTVCTPISLQQTAVDVIKSTLAEQQMFGYE
jgi:hypothetical protein